MLTWRILPQTGPNTFHHRWATSAEPYADLFVKRWAIFILWYLGQMLHLLQGPVQVHICFGRARRMPTVLDRCLKRPSAVPYLDTVTPGVIAVGNDGNDKRPSPDTASRLSAQAGWNILLLDPGNNQQVDVVLQLPRVEMATISSPFRDLLFPFCSLNWPVVLGQ